MGGKAVSNPSFSIIVNKIRKEEKIMSKNLLCKMAVLIVVCMISTTTWAAVWIGAALPDPNDPNVPNNLWNINANWSTGVPPISGEDVYIDQVHPLQPLVDASVTGFGGLARIGGAGATQILTITGGSVTFSNHCILGEGSGSHGILDISGGAFQSATLWAGNSGNATVYMRGGSVILMSESLYVDRFNKTSSAIYLDGGVIEQNGGIYIGSGGLVDITEGTLILNGDRSGTVNNYITDGKIRAYGGESTVIVDYDTINAGKTTITAVVLKKAWKPSPGIGDVVEDLQADLSWMPGSGAIDHTIYFGTNQTAVANGDSSVLMGTQNELSFDPNLLISGQTYYWRIDEFDGSTVYPGDLWSFSVIDPKQASNPDPANGATGVTFDQPELSWTAGAGAVSHDVYMGVSADSLEAVSLGQAETNLALGTLIKGKKYFWRVDESDGEQITEGVLWNFTVVPGAGSTTWTNNDPNSESWSSELNWNNGTPGSNSDIYINSEPNVVIDDMVAAFGAVSRISITHPTDPNLPMIFMTGGTATLTGDFVFGQNNGSRPVMQISGGTANIASVWTGNMDNWNMGSGKIQITGGIVNCGYLHISRSSPTTGQKGAIQLDGGVINANSLNMGHGYMDIKDGILVINGNAVNQVKGYIYDGWITAFDGATAVSVDYDQTNPGKTTVMACQKVLQSDFNGDCIVDLLDFEVLAAEWLSTFDKVDLDVLAGEWLQ